MPPKFKYFFIIALAVGIGCHFFTWVKFLFIERNGLNGGWESGRLTIVLMAATLILTVMSGKQSIIAMWANVICGGVGLAIHFYFIMDNGLLTSFGPGLYVTMFTELAILIAGLILVDRNRQKASQ